MGAVFITAVKTQNGMTTLHLGMPGLLSWLGFHFRLSAKGTLGKQYVMVQVLGTLLTQWET